MQTKVFSLLPIEDSSQTAYNEFRADISVLSDEEIGVHLEERVLELTIYDALLWGELCCCSAARKTVERY